MIPAGIAAQNKCKFREDMELGARAGESLRVDAGAGKLVIRGSGGTGQVRVAATLCASDEDRLAALDVTLDGGRLDTDYPRNRAGGWFGGNRYARIDLVVEVPAGMNLRVEDSSGSVEITGVGEVEIDDGSGSIQLRGVAAVEIDDGSGSLRIEDVAGHVTVRDVDGDLVVTDTRRSRIRHSDIRGTLDLPTERRKGRSR